MATVALPQRAAHDTVEHGGALAILTLGVLAATLMQTLDMTIVNVALPAIQGNLGATLDESAWVVTGYIISAVIVIPLTPWLQLRFGRRQYYATAIAGFTIASMFCGFATSIQALVVWRIVQGLFGGGLIATGQATLRDIFPHDKVGMSQGIFAIGALVGPSVGPTLGGWLTDNFSWNYVFFINLVPGIFATVVVLLRLRNPSEPRRIRVDALGLALLAGGLGSLQYVLDEGQRNDWFADARIAWLSIFAVALLIAFACWELLGTAVPVVDLRALRYRAVTAASVLGLAIGASLFGAIVIVPQYLQTSLGFTATESGEMIFWRAMVSAICTPIAARLASAKTIDVRIVLFAGFAAISVSQFWLGTITTPLSDFGLLLGPLLLSGAGASFVFIPLSIAVLSAVPPQVAPKATAFQNLSFQVGGSFSVAALVTLLARREAFHQEALAQFASAAHRPFAQFLQGHGSLMHFYSAIVNQATVLSFADAQYALGVLTLAMIPLVFVLPRRRRA